MMLLRASQDPKNWSGHPQKDLLEASKIKVRAHQNLSRPHVEMTCHLIQIHHWLRVCLLAWIDYHKIIQSSKIDQILF